MISISSLAALAGMESFQNRSSEKTWLTSILKHKIIDQFRKTQEQPLNGDEWYSAWAEELFDDRGRWKKGPIQWDLKPERLYEQKEFWRTIENCLGGLPERLARAFQMREMDGSNCEEICKVLDLSSTNWWVTLYRARMFMRRCLENNWFGNQGKDQASLDI